MVQLQQRGCPSWWACDPPASIQGCRDPTSGSRCWRWSCGCSQTDLQRCGNIHWDCSPSSARGWTVVVSLTSKAEKSCNDAIMKMLLHLESSVGMLKNLCTWQNLLQGIETPGDNQPLKGVILANDRFLEQTFSCLLSYIPHAWSTRAPFSSGRCLVVTCIDINIRWRKWF